MLSARALCPCRAGSALEPSFPLYLDVLAPYVNQVNLIRAGVPKIVSTVTSLLPGQRRPGPGCLRGALITTRIRAEEGVTLR